MNGCANLIPVSRPIRCPFREPHRVRITADHQPSRQTNVVVVVAVDSTPAAACMHHQDHIHCRSLIWRLCVNDSTTVETGIIYHSGNNYQAMYVQQIDWTDEEWMGSRFCATTDIEVEHTVSPNEMGRAGRAPYEANTRWCCLYCCSCSLLVWSGEAFQFTVCSRDM